MEKILIMGSNTQLGSDLFEVLKGKSGTEKLLKIMFYYELYSEIYNAEIKKMPILMLPFFSDNFIGKWEDGGKKF